MMLGQIVKLRCVKNNFLEIFDQKVVCKLQLTDSFEEPNLPKCQFNSFLLLV